MYYRLWDSAFKKRILPVCGDLAKPLLGLSSEIWQHLAQEIDIICHNGAWVNFVHPYSTLKPANVLGTQELLRLACAQKTKPFHYVSTAGVFGNSIATQRPAYTETDDLPMDAIINGGYCQSKRVAEHLVKTASARGLPISIHRPSFIVGDSASGTCNADDFFFRILRGYISLGKAPKMEEMLDLVTVDYVSQAIVWLSKRIESTGNVFHLTNSVEIPLSTLLDWTNALGYRVDIIPESDWKSELYDAMQNNEEHPLFPLYSLLERSFRVESTSPEYTPRIDCQYTLNQLAESGIACPNITPLIWEMHLAWLKQVSLNI
jgi:myxalamid-type nonribosomal peptide synthetase MxaA